MHFRVNVTKNSETGLITLCDFFNFFNLSDGFYDVNLLKGVTLCPF